MAQGIHDGTKVLLSSIELPDEPVLQYSIYSSGAADPLVHVESARRKLCTPSAQSLFSSPITRIHFTSGSPLLYVFHVASNGDESPTMALDDLTRTSSSEIVIGMAVSEQMLCDQDHGPSSGSCNCSHSRAALDRESNLAQKLFLDAVRDRLVDEICIASLGKGHIPAVRLQNGFCLLPQRRNNEWTSKWEAGNNTGLIFCEMQLHLTATHILVQPLPCRLTSLAQIEDMSSGSAILLLPHGIPAFYIQQHSADDATVSEFSESFSQNGVSQTVSKDFARCYVPFRRVNDRQDGGITTIWPRALILATPSRPSLSAFSSQSGAVAASNQRPMQKMTIASSLTSLSLEPAVNLSMLSLAMGRFVDAALKERERPKAEPSQIVSGPQTSQAAQLIADEPTARPSTLNDALQANTAPQPQPRLGPAQSYPSPLEMITNRHEPGSSTAPQVPAPTDEPMVTDSKPEPSVAAANATEPQPPPPEEAPPAQPTFTASQASLNPWNSMGGFSDGNFGFGGGASGMQSETFGSDMFTEDDFTFFDVPAVHSSSTAALVTQNGAGQGVNGTSQNAGLPDVILALSGQTSDFGKLDASLMDWSVPETSEFSVVGGMTSLNNNTQEVFSAADFDLSAFLNDSQLVSLLGKD
ncbi:hypothetical protein M408DRAFT_24751 [Serendipita vermifera MAFF 305830]|uniref:Mediator complex subunit Med13 N-terminal domain-containing protein n=1 Tax=Serendipita vermifera MAFF 305830 TaxID=933852 RepID=A0A0C3B523_SERVB|nr:hypothetical protein M408DRAFT_24751 [Serendipita vermifera MAFF 305830]